MNRGRFEEALMNLRVCAKVLERVGGDLAKLGQNEAEAADELLRLCERMATARRSGKEAA